ncbi:MAG TPA: hypothetical protein VFT22_18480 [Kofleriaceae bacterium]|nr:hypothetical protein [Kofleriaceae bacterium]
MRNPVLLLALFLAAGCDPDPSAPDCTPEASVTGRVISGPTDQLVDKDLRVRGVAAHSRGLAIRRILVAGIAASNDGFNFDNWSATLPIDTLAGMARTATPVTIGVSAIDACERTFALDSFMVNVDPTPGVRVTELKIASQISSGLDYIPANGSVPALLTITGNADAAHAVVTLSASTGTFTGAPGNQVTLEGDGSAPATATVLYAATTPSSEAVLITASAKGQLAQTSVRVAGPPTLIPGSATLAPGQDVAVTVQTQGTVQACQATPAQGITITSGGDLMAIPGGIDSNGDHLIDITILAADPLTAAASSTITCRDPYGQFSTGTYRTQAP